MPEIVKRIDVLEIIALFLNKYKKLSYSSSLYDSQRAFRDKFDNANYLILKYFRCEIADEMADFKLQNPGKAYFIPNLSLAHTKECIHLLYEVFKPCDIFDKMDFPTASSVNLIVKPLFHINLMLDSYQMVSNLSSSSRER